MTPLQFDLWSLLLALGISQGVVLIVVTAIRRNRSPEALFFGILLFILTFTLLEFLLLSSNYYHYFPHLSRVSDPLHFLIGPLFYFYVRVVLGEKLSLKPLHLLHLVPFLMVLIYHAPWYLEPVNYKVAIIEMSMTDQPREVSPFGFSMALFHIGQVITYVVLSINVIQLCIRNTLTVGRPVSPRIRYLKSFSYTFLAYWLLQLSGLLVITIYSLYVYQVDYVLAMLNSFLIQVLGIVLLTRPEAIFNGNGSGKYSHSPLDEEHYNRLRGQISDLMEREIYLDPDLTLDRFSQELNVNKNYISQVINREFNTNFNDFINQHRIDKAKRLMKAGDQMKLLAVALESGFNNKTSFTRAFRRQTGMTAGEWRSELV